MIKYLIREGSVKYQVLLYSENPELINLLKEKLYKENISLVVKTIGHQRVDNQIVNTSSGNLLKTIYDLSSVSDLQNNIALDVNGMSDDLILIFKTQNKKAYQKIKLKNKIVLIEEPSKKVYEDVVDFITQNLTDKNGEVVVFGKKKKREYRYSGKAFVLCVFIFVLIYPYIIYLYSLFGLLLSSNVFRKTPLEYLEKAASFDTKVKLALYRTNGYYSTFPFIKHFYLDVYKYSKNEYLKSLYILETINKMSDVNLALRNVLIENAINTPLTNKNTRFAFDGSLITDNVKPKELVYINNSLDKYFEIFMSFNRYASREPNYFLLLWQDDSSLSPTGGISEEVVILSLSEKKIDVIGKTSGKDLSANFKGSISNINTYPDFNLLLQDSALDINDKFLVYSAIIKSIYNLDITGMVVIEDSEKENVINTKNILNSKMSYLESKDIYDLINSALDNRNLYFYLVGEKNVITNEFFFEKENNNTIQCFDNEFYFAEITKDVLASSSSVKLVGKEDAGLLNIGIYYSNISEKRDYSILIYPPDNLKNTIASENRFFQRRLEFKGKELTLYNFNGPVNNTLIAEYSIPVEDCDSGFGLSFVKQSGNKNLSYQLEIETQLPSYLYVDSLLTSWGNKFYNSGLVIVNKNTKFEFLYKN